MQCTGEATLNINQSYKSDYERHICKKSEKISLFNLDHRKILTNEEKTVNLIISSCLSTFRVKTKGSNHFLLSHYFLCRQQSDFASDIY